MKITFFSHRHCFPRPPGIHETLCEIARQRLRVNGPRTPRVYGFRHAFFILFFFWNHWTCMCNWRLILKSATERKELYLFTYWTLVFCSERWILSRLFSYLKLAPPHKFGIIGIYRTFTIDVGCYFSRYWGRTFPLPLSCILGPHLNFKAPRLWYQSNR